MNSTEKWPYNVELRRRFLFPGDDPDIDCIPEERLLFLFDFVLTEKQKAVLEDRYRDGMSVAEIAEKESITKGRVYQLDRIIFNKLNNHKDQLLLDQNVVFSNTKISDIVPSVRICRALHRRGVEVIEDLLGLTYDELIKTRNIGSKAIQKLSIALEEYGVSIQTSNSVDTPHN